MQNLLKRIQALDNIADWLQVFTIRRMRLAVCFAGVVRTQYEPTRFQCDFPEVRSQLNMRVPMMRTELEGRVLSRAEVSERVDGDEDLTDAVYVVSWRPKSQFRAEVVSDCHDDAGNVCGDRARPASAGGCLAELEVDDVDGFGALLSKFHCWVVSMWSQAGISISLGLRSNKGSKAAAMLDSSWETGMQ
jgi:hypothetical protein